MGISRLYVRVQYVFVFDFAGYSLFAVGTSYMMGYQTPINFNKPFYHGISKNSGIVGIWRCPFGSVIMYICDWCSSWWRKIFKSKIVMSNIGYFALFLLMGIWHGLTWYYIVYGLYHACLICLTDAWIRFKKKHKEQLPSNKFTHGLAVFLTFQAVCFSFLIFQDF